MKTINQKRLNPTLKRHGGGTSAISYAEGCPYRIGDCGSSPQ